MLTQACKFYVAKPSCDAYFAGAKSHGDFQIRGTKAGATRSTLNAVSFCCIRNFAGLVF